MLVACSWDNIARELKKEYPDKWVTGYAYSAYQKPPVNYTMTEKVLVGVVAFNSFPALPNETAADQSIWRGWADAGARQLFLRPNVGGQSVGRTLSFSCTDYCPFMSTVFSYASQ